MPGRGNRGVSAGRAWRLEPMSTFTTAREQSHAAAQKAQDAYALARRLEHRIEGLEALLRDAAGDIAELGARLVEAEDEVARLSRDAAAGLGGAGVAASMGTPMGPALGPKISTARTETRKRQRAA